MSVIWSDVHVEPNQSGVYYEMRTGIEILEILPAEVGADTTMVRLRPWIWLRYSRAYDLNVTTRSGAGTTGWGAATAFAGTASGASWATANQIPGPELLIRARLDWTPTTWEMRSFVRYVNTATYTLIDGLPATTTISLPARDGEHGTPTSPWPTSGTHVPTGSAAQLAIAVDRRGDPSAVTVRRRWRKVGTVDWATAEAAASMSTSYPDGIERSALPAIPATGLTGGTEVEWQAQTRGQNATWGEWSTPARLTFSTPPQITNLRPSGTINASSTTAMWDWIGTHPQGSATATLRHAGATLETVTVTSANTAPLSTALVDGATYELRVAGTDVYGLAAPITSSTFTVSFLPPATPTVTIAFDEVDGSAALTIVNPTGVPGTVPAIRNRVEVSRDGSTWTPVAEGPPNSTIKDLAAMQGASLYRVSAISALPSVATAAPVALTIATTWLYLTTRSGKVLRFRGNPSAPLTVDRDQKLHMFEGRRGPYLVEGEAIRETLDVKVLIEPGISSTWEELRDARREGGTIMWRDPEMMIRGHFDGPLRIERPGLKTATFKLVAL
ncbi:MAG: hypothetical protein Q4G35_03230 [Propionibacteriaceae bacterium]|nr:hypothetical protein [Propionibacteriaceae bacterium]